MLFHTHFESLPEVISIGPELLYPLAQDPEAQVRLGREGVPPPRMRLRSSLSLFPDGLKWTFPRWGLRHSTFAFFRGSAFIPLDGHKRWRSGCPWDRKLDAVRVVSPLTTDSMDAGLRASFALELPLASLYCKTKEKNPMRVLILVKISLNLLARTPVLLAFNRLSFFFALLLYWYELFVFLLMTDFDLTYCRFASLWTGLVKKPWLCYL